MEKISMLDAALSYLRRGWSIIPTRRSDKEPLVKWHPYQKRLPTENEVRQWWTEHPHANIALITGRVSGVIALDIDPQRGGDVERVWSGAPTGIAAKSGGGGQHLFYKHPGGEIPNLDHDGVEVKGDGGNIHLPPSVHRSGRRYQWVSEGALAPMPKRLLASFSNGNGKSNGKPTEPWLTRILQGVAEGDRNKAASRLAGYYIGKGMPTDVVVSTLESWDLKNRPPLTSEDPDLIKNTVESVARTHNRRRADAQPVRVSVSSGPEEPFSLMDFRTYMTKFGDMPVSWGVEEWLPERTIAMAVAPPGTYKTWLELALAVSIASGKPFLNRYEIHQPGPVLIIQQEDYHGQMAERLAVVAGSMFDFGARSRGSGGFEFDAPPNLPIYLHPDRRFRFADRVVMESMEEKIDEIRPVIVILDPLYSTGPMDDFGVKLVNDMWPLKAMRDKYGCSFFISHHTSKNKEETDREDLWGNQFLNAFIETGWQIRKKNEETAIVRRHFKVRKDIGEEVIKFDISTVPPYRFDVSLRAPTANEKESPDLLALLHTLGPMSQSTMARKAGVDKSTISRRLRKLIEAKVVYKDEVDQYHPSESI